MNKGGLYFHIPFCLRKCLYCDFCSYTDRSDEQMRVYIDAMKKEMRAQSNRARDTVFDTIFFGGGTPSLLPASLIEDILWEAQRCFSIDKDAEITLEANPATASKEKLRSLRTLGVNRLSVGVQSTSDAELRALGRLHTGKEALRFLADAQRAGFENISVDLMYGIPDQTAQSAQKTLSDVLSFTPSHVSAYSLMLEEGTPLYRTKNSLALPSEEEEETIHRILCEGLAEKGYLHYEISNYAHRGREARHNLHYWRSEPYLGFGVSAYSFFEGARYGNGTDMEAYLSDPTEQTVQREVLNEKDLAYEWIMLRFRLAEGLSLSEYRARFGVNLEVRFAQQIARFSSLGLLRCENGRIALTEQGFRLSNEILVAFMTE